MSRSWSMRGRRVAALALGCSLALGWAAGAAARPNTHAPAISTWDSRASNVVVGLGQAVSGGGAFTFASYNANFVSTSGVLEAQFGVHYVTYREGEDSPTARGFSAGGVALISLPLSERFDNGVPRSSFAFYVGGVPTALFSGQLNFISVPLVLGVGVPFSPVRSLSLRPWAELSPGLNFDTRIQPISTAAAIESARDGSLTRDEVEELVEEGLDISRETSVATRAGLSVGIHLGESVDFDVNVSIGSGKPSAVALGAGVVLRWDRMVVGVEPDDGNDCASWRARCAGTDAPAPSSREPRRARPARRRAPPPQLNPKAAPARAPRTAPPPPRGAGAAQAPARPKAAPPTTRRRPSPPEPPPSPTRQAPKKAAPPPELPPLQAAPPR